MRLLARLLVSFVILSAPLAAGGCSGGDAASPDDNATADALSSASGRTAFKFFVGKGLSEIQAAAIVGNLQQESGVDPRSVQPGGPGRGIAQWSTGDRWNAKSHDNVLWYAAQQGESSSSLELQLEFTWYELESFDHYGLSALKSASTISSAVNVFQRDFEACGTCNASARVRYANAALAAYGGG